MSFGIFVRRVERVSGGRGGHSRELCEGRSWEREVRMVPRWFWRWRGETEFLGGMPFLVEEIEGER
jgi:hypothetical protein